MLLRLAFEIRANVGIFRPLRRRHRSFDLGAVLKQFFRKAAALFNRPDKWWRWAWTVWIILAVLAVGRAGLRHLPRHQGCYVVFADGGRHWLHGEDLYDSANPDSLTVFRYSPLVAVVLTPLALMPDVLGDACMRTVGLLVLLPALLWWSRTALPASLTREQRSIFFLLIALMTNESLMDVQLNILTIGFMLIAMAACSTERWTIGALAASLACCFKAYPIALALVLVLVFPRKFAWRSLLMLACCLAAPFALQRPDYVWHQYEEWFRWGLNQRGGQQIDWFQDFMLFWRRWIGPMERSTYFRIEVLTGAAVAVICLIQRFRGASRQGLLNSIFGLCCGWMMAFGPATEPTTYIMLAPAVAGAMMIMRVFPQPIWYRAAVLTTCTLLAAAQLQLLFPLGRPFHHWGAQPFAAVLFMIAVAFRGLGDLRKT